MSDPTTDNDASKDATTDANDTTTDANDTTTSRRTFVKAMGAATALGGAGSLLGRASAAESLDGYLTPSGEETIPAGQYDWNDQNLSVGSGDALVGGGGNGDVVWNLQSGTMDGTVEGRLENVVVRGDNPEPKAGIDLAPGGEIDGFIWPEGGGQSEDRALYHPTGGGRTYLRNSAFGWMANNGAYLDKAPITMENVAAVNNNITNIRVGHWQGSDQSATTYIRNCLAAVTQTPRHDDEAGSHSRGIRLRHPAHLVIENCWIVYYDVDGTADLIELHDEAAGSTVEIRNCHLYNDSGGALVRDKSGGGFDVTIENCTVAGSGSREVQPDYSGNGFTEQDVTVPMPSAITGYAVADEIEGISADMQPFGSGAAPGGGSGGDEDDQQTTDPSSYDHTLVLHGDPENPTGSAGIAGDFDLDITVSGAATRGDSAESSDSITSNADGSSTIQVNNLGPDELDSFRFDGEVVSYVRDPGYSLDVSLDGTTTTLEELVDGDSSGGSGDDPTTTTTTSASTPTTTTDSTTTTPDQTTTTPDQTTTTTTTSDGSDDSDNDDSDGGSGGSLSSRISFDGRDDGDVTTYTFTVSGSVERDAEASEVSEDGLGWDRLEDVARDGKVLGLVGSGVDAFRFSGDVTSITVDGDAAVSIERDV